MSHMKHDGWKRTLGIAYFFRGELLNFWSVITKIKTFQRSHVEPELLFGQSLWPCLRRISAFWMLFPSAYPGVKLS